MRRSSRQSIADPVSIVLVLLLRLRQVCNHPALITEREGGMEAAGHTRAEVEVERARKFFGEGFVSKVKAKIRDLETERMEVELTVCELGPSSNANNLTRYSNPGMTVKVARSRNVRSASTFSQMVSSLGVVIYSVASASVSLAPLAVTLAATQGLPHDQRVSSITLLQTTRRT